MSSETELIDALARASYAVTAVLSSMSAEFHLSLTQGRVLGILSDRTLRMAELAEYLGLERSTMSGLIDRAEERGLLRRERAQGDRRVIEVSLTAAGHALADQARARIQVELAPLVERLNAAEQRTTAELLEWMLGPAPEPGRGALG